MMQAPEYKLSAIFQHYVSSIVYKDCMHAHTHTHTYTHRRMYYDTYSKVIIKMFTCVGCLRNERLSGMLLELLTALVHISWRNWNLIAGHNWHNYYNNVCILRTYTKFGLWNLRQS